MSVEDKDAISRNRALKDKNRDGADIPGTIIPVVGMYPDVMGEIWNLIVSVPDNCTFKFNIIGKSLDKYSRMKTKSTLKHYLSTILQVL